MRRHEPVHDGEAREKRDGEKQKRFFCLCCECEQNRQQKHESDRKPCRQPDRDGEDHDAPNHALRTEERIEAFCQHLRATALCQEFPEHRAEADNSGDSAERLAEPNAEDVDDSCHCERSRGSFRRHAHGDSTCTDDECRKCECDKCVHFPPCHEQYEHGDRGKR